MPKASSSRPSSPVKGSPTKRSHRKQPTGSFSIPLGTTTSTLPSFPRQANSKRGQADAQLASEPSVLLLENLGLGPSPSCETSHAPTEDFWLAEDIFPNANSQRVTSPVPPFPPLLPDNDIPTEEEVTVDMGDVETALDEAVVTSGLVSMPLFVDESHALLLLVFI